MADTTARTLRLLSLLQRRRYWPGPELAARLGVSDRTLRRDVDRLRELGYTVDADRGVDGGYRLGGAASDAALLLDSDEAVALAVALHAAASGTSEWAEAALGALTKVLPLLGAAPRRRVETVRAATAFGSPPASAAPALSVLDVVASACRDRVRLSFGYRAADGAVTERYVEPCRVVALDGRWYLVAWDGDRDDWRTFRIDRLSRPVTSRNTFAGREPPAVDLAGYVRFSMRERVVRHRVVVEIAVPGHELREAYGQWVTVDDLGGDRCRVTMEAESFLWPTHIVANVDAAFTVVAPPAFADHLRSLAARLGAAGPAAGAG